MPDASNRASIATGGAGMRKKAYPIGGFESLKTGQENMDKIRFAGDPENNLGLTLWHGQ